MSQPALDGEVTAEQASELPRQGKAETGTALAWIAAALECLEYRALFFRSDALTVVYDVESHEILGRANVDPNNFTLGTVPNRVREQIDEDLPYPLRVGPAR